jgi:RHS repeat-associated protein
VRVQLAGSQYLVLGEVQVWGQQSQTTDAEWLVADQLGTPRMMLDQTGSLSGVKRHDYLPFGEELYANTGVSTAGQGYVADAVRQKFISKERDDETGLDYFNTRYYASVQGRFTSADSFGGRVVNPQTLNLYAYVRNNPLKYIDPTGHQQQDSNKPDRNAVIVDEALIGPPPPWHGSVTMTYQLLGIAEDVQVEIEHQRLPEQMEDFIFQTMSPLGWLERRVLPPDVYREWHSPSTQIPLAMTVVGGPIAADLKAEEVSEEMSDAAAGEIDALIEDVLSSDAVVVRGGRNLPENFQMAPGSQLTVMVFSMGYRLIVLRGGVSRNSLEAFRTHRSVLRPWARYVKRVVMFIRIPRALIRTIARCAALRRKRQATFHTYNP